jgi:hypothetical protein
MTITVIGLPQVLTHLANLSGAMRDLNGLKATIGTPLDYAEAVHEGSRAHDIFPVNGKALFWPGARHPVRSVHHPGNAPNPFLHEVFTARRNDITASLVLGIGVATQNTSLHAAGPFGNEIDDVTGEAQQAAPVRSGKLRASLHAEFRDSRSRG